MKQILAQYKTYMIRPILYKSVTRCSIALAVLLLWDRFVGHNAALTVWDGAAAVGLFLLMMSWFSYLRLDGMKVHYIMEDRRKKRTKRRRTGDIADYMDEHIVSFDELDETEQKACYLASNLLSGLLFFIPGLVLSLTSRA